MLKSFRSMIALAAVTVVSSFALSQAPASPLSGGGRGGAGAAGGAAQAGGSRGAGQQTGGAPVPITTDITKVKLLPGARIEVHTFEEPDLDGSYRLDALGNVSIPLIGLVHLSGLTPLQAETAIGAALISNEILKEAHVTVALAEYGTAFVTVLGEVNAPGRYPAVGPLTLAEVLATAGGETVFAGDEITLRRASRSPENAELVHYKRADIDSSALSVEIDPGDTLLVKRAGVVYVLGAVTRPGGYLMQDDGQLNVDQALALALGTTITGKIGSILVLRKQADGTIATLPVNYTKINKGQEVSLQLAADDVVYVPQSVPKNILVRATSIFTSAASATIYSAEGR